MPLSRFALLRFPLLASSSVRQRLPDGARTKLSRHLDEAEYSVRLLRYWWAGQALAAESRRLRRPLQVVDLGCERGWLRHFTPEGVVERWTGLDWNPPEEARKLARYDEVHHANFDEPLPLPSGCADAVVSLHVFEHLPRPGSTMSEVSRLLKPDGVFLGAAPTMPSFLARWRERWFRSRLARGLVAAGGHITVLSPSRWRALAEDVGLQPEFITGSHALRLTGSALENWRSWIRLNQIWGAISPSLGSECCIQARRTAPWVASTDRLAPDDPHWRKAWVSVTAIAVVALFFGISQFTLAPAKAPTSALSFWLDAHQRGADVFIVNSSLPEGLLPTRKDVLKADDFLAVERLLEDHPHAHVLVSISTAKELIQHPSGHVWRIDSRLELDGEDYLLLHQNDRGTLLQEYLLGVQEGLPAPSPPGKTPQAGSQLPHKHFSTGMEAAA